MAVDSRIHQAVVVIDSKVYYGFSDIASAIGFIENQVVRPVVDSDKVFGLLSEVLSDGINVLGVNYEILDTDSFLDVYGADDEGVDEDEDDE
ncbi:hypothetical protein [Streptomyces hebeiensis]